MRLWSFCFSSDVRVAFPAFLDTVLKKLKKIRVKALKQRTILLKLFAFWKATPIYLWDRPQG